MEFLNLTFYLLLVFSLNLQLVNGGTVEGKCQDEFADKCENKIPLADCALVFTNDPEVKDGLKKVDPKCVEENKASLVKLCQLRCWDCCNSPQYSCEDKNGLPISCKEAEASGACKSSDLTLKKQMKESCQRTCGLCEGELTCKDSNPKLCKEKQADCDTDKEFMYHFCPKTCAKCNGTNGSSGSCTDADAQCATWVKKGFCTKPFYSVEERRKRCAKSCNLC